jgi:GR25 family glycosyltransferase involved in LPS biosynthesis/tetratricopeptide (TPR) repeat protein
MIVKNEAHVIVKTLNNLCEKIDFSYWVICDTGSTDNTKEVIMDFFKGKNIKGELLEHEWRDFGYNRTLALESAYNKTDLLFIFDADDEIVGDLVLPKVYDHDGYTFNFGNDIFYIRPLLINNRKRWRFIGVLHEYIACSENSTPHKNIEGNYYIVSGRTGNRSQNPNKYFDDANILKKAHYDVLETDYGLSCRYAFYCAQSYKDSGYIDESIEWYKKCLDLNMWLQEKYVSAFSIGNLYMNKNDMKNALKYWYKTIEYDPERIEGIINAINYLTREGEHLIVNALYHRFKNYNKNLHEKLFMVDSCYKDQLEYNNSISAFYSQDKTTGYECCKKIFANRQVNDALMKATISNFLFYIDVFEKDDDSEKLRMFYLIDDIVGDFGGNKNEILEPNMIICWNKLFDICRSLLCAPSSPSMSHLFKKGVTDSKADSIMITFTTCKRIDLFKQTVYSILNHWLDIKSICTWFCVDDNSSDEDRKRMRSLFPWIQYYMKTDEEKGHRQSMNIIWNKLKETTPKYWIHMEDDFLFHRKMNYIEEGINALKSPGCINQNVKQILFNRNYGEIIDHYNSRGHVSMNDGGGGNVDENIVLHKHCDGIFDYMNCHYWPHYSFRPSIIDTSAILELGDYHSENHFFEMDYAKKWAEKGYKSAFFNKITCRHIGRLTSDRNTKSVANAYDLNNEDQFGNKATDVTNAIEHTENSNAFIKIINLERRGDRKKETMKKMMDAGVSSEDYEFINAVDGLLLSPTCELKYLFRNNDFGSRKCVIGCALSHYNLWKQLVNDSQHEYYVIMEDDFVLCSNFKKQLDTLKSNNEFTTREVLFLGYHMFEKDRKYDVYNLVSEVVDVKELNKDLYIGGYFAYSINKNGAKNLLEYIDQNGINHGIDYLNKILDNNILHSHECQPQIVFSDWNENGKEIDSDIQNTFDSIDFSRVDIEKKMNSSNKNGLTPTNTSFFHRGRLGNLFFVNMCLHFISKKNNLYCAYQYYEQIKQLGIELHIGEKTYDETSTIPLLDTNFFDFITGDCINKNVSIVNNMWCQTPEFARYLRSYFDEEKNKNNIITNNLYKERYNNNNDVFIHIRLGDIINENFCQKIDYYNKVLSNIDFDNGYISSDSIDSYICKILIIKYNLKIIDYDEVNTIMFGSTCKHIVLSNGTFSWLIGFLAYYSTVYYPKIIHKWHGDIFIFDSWNEIERDETDKLDVYDDLFKKYFTFIPGVDVICCDLYMRNVSLEEKFLTAIGDPECVCFNTLGFFKDDVTNLQPSCYFKEGDGIYIKNHVYEDYLESQNQGTEIIRIKMLCNWTDSKQLCKGWSNMCEPGLRFRWKNYRMVWTDHSEDIDYYVIINSPPAGAYYDPKKTIVFQMEPWVHDENKPWGVKTWGEWAEPDENKFMHVHSHKKYLNIVQWLNTIPEKMVKCEHEQKNRVISIISEKNFDEGHIKRIEFIRYMESMSADFVDIYGRQNYHNFMNYSGTVENDNKYKNYKYCISVENNSEYNYATEKIWEPILCECLCFYWGCPNIGDYIDSKAFVLLDMNDFEKSYQIIKQALEEDWWADRINIIRKEKEKILNDLAFFPTLDKIIQNNPLISNYFINNNISVQCNPNSSFGKVYICGCVKNNSKYLKDVFKNIDNIVKLFNDYKIIIAYDDSSDNSLDILHKMSKYYKMEIIICDNKNSYTCENICKARNKILQHIRSEENNKEFNYMIFMDTDDVCAGNISIENIETMLHRNDEWDAISFNRDDYYDIWALSLDEYVISCHHWENWMDVANTMKNYIKEKLNNLSENELLDVYSAFNGFAIYRIEKFINCDYECNFKNNVSYFTETVIKNNEKILNKVINNDLVVDCEHRHFHLDAIKKYDAKIRVTPLMLIKNDIHYKCLIENIELQNDVSTFERKQEDGSKYVCSRGILKSCHVKSSTPISSTQTIINYNFDDLKDGSTVYVCSNAIKDFINIFDTIDKKIILVTGDCDETVPNDIFNTTDDFINFIESDKIIHWFSQNCVGKHSKLTGIPIGLDYHTMTNKDHEWGAKISPFEQELQLEEIKKTMLPFYERILKCYSNFHFLTTTRYGCDRIEAINNIPKDLVFYEDHKIKRVESWGKQSEYAFVISPHGNGLDCHRTWEALCLGCIPIVKSSEIDYLYDDLPVLIVNSWSDITYDILTFTINKFKDLHNNNQFDYNKLTLSYWVDKINNL